MARFSVRSATEWASASVSSSKPAIGPWTSKTTCTRATRVLVASPKWLRRKDRFLHSFSASHARNVRHQSETLSAARPSRVLLPFAAWKNGPSARMSDDDGVGWGLPIAGEPTVHRWGSSIAVRVLIADAARHGYRAVLRLRLSRGSEVATTRPVRAAAGRT